MMLCVLTIGDVTMGDFMPAGRPLTAAEIRIQREYLGLSEVALAAYLGVTDRAVRHWEAGRNAMPEDAHALFTDLSQQTATTVETIVRDSPLMDSPRPAIFTYRTDEEFAASGARSSRDRPLPASWHRALCARVAHRIPGLAVIFVGDVPLEGARMWETNT